MLQAARWEFVQGVPSGASCFDGHFPDNPIVPGAYLLALAEAKLSDHGWKIVSARRIKFLAPLGPDQAFRIEAVPGTKAITLRWLRGEEKIAEATVTLRATA